MKVPNDFSMNSPFLGRDMNKQEDNLVDSNKDDSGFQVDRGLKKRRKEANRVQKLLAKDLYPDQEFAKKKSHLLKKYGELVGDSIGKTLQSQSRDLGHRLKKDKNPDTIIDTMEPAIAYVLGAYGALASDGKDKEAFQGFVDGLMKNHEQEILSGVNTSAAFAKFSTDPAIKKQIRQIYYETLILNSSLHSLFDQLLSSFGDSLFELGLKSIQRGLSDDLKSGVSSSNKDILKSILSSLNQASQLSGLAHNVDDFLTELTVRNIPIQLSKLDLCKGLIKQTLAPMYARDLKRLIEKSVSNDNRHISLFLNGYSKLLKDLPLNLWKEERVRNTTFRLILVTLESLYDTVEEQKKDNKVVKI
ncbi:hypothetical protein CSB62_23735 [Vibrio splendidus]|uniref:Hypersensitivity response secretion-like HrpJ domain-containing protein n=4 Tax=Vibrio lentus TaxID=136468 RepID=A0A855ISE7_9VIBR|nr:hypothetical protein CSB62_23735 [Vibrio splendidus]PMF00075.1 hypothetical protein BCV23_08545 [Vibrio lentus]PMF76223.1 hypothetical protein BCV10_18740 [Vibrio lentus]PMG70396.1 hypothetical protein BCU85_24060 [Vibrio lentus]PMH00918.1 hypothetical protein BCU78_15115 [Vibrio lentus]